MTITNRLSPNTEKAALQALNIAEASASVLPPQRWDEGKKGISKTVAQHGIALDGGHPNPDVPFTLYTPEERVHIRPQSYGTNIEADFKAGEGGARISSLDVFKPEIRSDPSPTDVAVTARDGLAVTINRPGVKPGTDYKHVIKGPNAERYTEIAFRRIARNLGKKTVERLRSHADDLEQKL